MLFDFLGGDLDGFLRLLHRFANRVGDDLLVLGGVAGIDRDRRWGRTCTEELDELLDADLVAHEVDQF